MRNLPWIGCGLAGLLVGLGLRGSPSDPSQDADAERAPTTRAAARAASAGEGLRGGRAREFLRGIAEADAAECERIIYELAALDGERPLEMEMVFRRWMQHVPPLELLERLRKLPHEESPRGWRNPFFAAWGAVDYEEAIGSTEAMIGFELPRAMAAVRYRDSRVDEIVRRVSPSDLSDDLHAELEILGRERPDLAALVTSPKAAASIARGWAAEDPAAAFAWVLATKAEPEAVAAVMAEWCKRDLKPASTALQEAGIDPSSLPRRGVWGRDQHLIALRDPDGTAAAMYLALERDPCIDVATLHQLLEGQDTQLTRGSKPSPAINADGWYPPDPVAALRDAERLPAGQAREFLLACICELWAAADPEAAWKYASDRGLRVAMSEPVTPELRDRMAEDPAAVMRSLIAPEHRQQFNELANEWARVDPRAAADWMVAQLTADVQLLEQLRLTGPLGNMVGHYWARHDAYEAIDWLENVPEGPVREAMWRGMSHYICEYSPELAISVANGLLHGESRMNSLRSISRRMSDMNGMTAALAHIETLPISRVEREALVNAVQAPNAGGAR